MCSRVQKSLFAIVRATQITRVDPGRGAAAEYHCTHTSINHYNAVRVCVCVFTRVYVVTCVTKSSYDNTRDETRSRNSNLRAVDLMISTVYVEPGAPCTIPTGTGRFKTTTSYREEKYGHSRRGKLTPRKSLRSRKLQTVYVFRPCVGTKEKKSQRITGKQKKTSYRVSDWFRKVDPQNQFVADGEKNRKIR